LLLRTAAALQHLGTPDQQSRIDTKKIADQAEHDDRADPETAAASRNPRATPAPTPIFYIFTLRHFIETHGPFSSEQRLSAWHRSQVNPLARCDGFNLDCENPWHTI
jgi:hypothetical protein